ncbi:MAG: hypothetical protein MJ174_07470 [Treponema sp.]|nr:hypothetical protein [Treponema sp.]
MNLKLSNDRLNNYPSSPLQIQSVEQDDIRLSNPSLSAGNNDAEKIKGINKENETKLHNVETALNNLIVLFNQLETKVNRFDIEINTDEIIADVGTIADIFAINVTSDVVNADKFNFKTGMIANRITIQPGTTVYAHTDSSKLFIVWLTPEYYIALTPDKFVWQISTDYTVGLQSGAVFEFSYIGTGAATSNSVERAVRLLSDGVTLQGALNATLDGVMDFSAGIIVEQLLQVEGDATINGNLSVTGAINGTTTNAINDKDGNEIKTTYIKQEEKGIANGVASLDEFQKVPVEQLPSAIMQYKGTWDCVENVPELADEMAGAVQGDVYVCSVAGSRDLGHGIIEFYEGDWVMYNGTIWERSANANLVKSVNGKQGVVKLDAEDVDAVSSTDFESKMSKVGHYFSVNCSSSGDSVHKTVTIPGYTTAEFQKIINGAIIGVTFTNGNTYGETTIADPTHPYLDVNFYTLHICDSKGHPVGKGCWNDGDYIEFRIDTANFKAIIINSDIREQITGGSGYTIYSDNKIVFQFYGEIKSIGVNGDKNQDFELPFILKDTSYICIINTGTFMYATTRQKYQNKVNIWAKSFNNVSAQNCQFFCEVIGYL